MSASSNIPAQPVEAAPAATAPAPPAVQPAACEEPWPRGRRDAYALDWADSFGRVRRHYFETLETAQSVRAEMARTGRTVVLVELAPALVDLGSEATPDGEARPVVRRCESPHAHGRHSYWHHHAAVRRSCVCPGGVAGRVVVATVAELDAAHQVEIVWSRAAGRYASRCQCGWRSASWVSRAPASLEGRCHQVEQLAQAASGAVVVVLAEVGR